MNKKPSYSPNQIAFLFSIFVISWGSGNSALANVVGTDAQNFNPLTSGIDFVTVHSSETLRPGYLNLGLFSNFATNSLPRYGAQSSDYHDSLLGMDLGLGLGLLKNWDFGVSVPSVAYQNISNPSGFSGHYADRGFTEVKLNTKYRVYGDDRHGVALIASSNFNLIRDNPYVGVGGGPGFNLEVAADRTFGRFAVALNAGHRWRNPGTPMTFPPILPFQNQWIASAATNYYWPKINTKFIIETFGSVPSSRAGGLLDRQQSSLELLGGAKHDLGDNWAVHLGLGRKVLAADLASPDFRVYGGVNFAIGPLFAKPGKIEQLQRVEPIQVAATPLAPPEPERFITQSLYFDTGSAELKPEAAEVLDQLVAILKKDSFRELLIEGHTDSIASEEYNQKLSERRANAIRDALIKNYKLDANKVRAFGFGETIPIADNGNFQGRSLNRRVEFKIDRHGLGPLTPPQKAKPTKSRGH